MERDLVNKKYEDMYDPFFEALFGGDYYSKKNHNLMATDITEDENEYTIKINLPEVEKKDIKLSLEKGSLTIDVDFNSKEENNKKFILRERYYSKISRSYYLGDNVKPEHLEAKLENGVLTINVKKVKEENKASLIEIK